MITINRSKHHQTAYHPLDNNNNKKKKFPPQGRHSHRIQQYQILGRFEQSQQKTGSSRINCQNGIPI